MAESLAAEVSWRIRQSVSRGWVDVLNQDLVTGYIVLAVLMVVLALPFVLFTPDPPLAPQDRKPFSWRRMASASARTSRSTRL